MHEHKVSICDLILSIEVDGLIADIECVVMERLIEGVDAILGMDFIQLAGGLEWKHD